MEINCYNVMEVQLSPVQADHYWASYAKLQYCDGEWHLRITDVFACNRWEDDTREMLKKLPERFPDMTAQEFASIVNSVGAAGPGGGRRNVKPEEVMPLLKAAKAMKK